MNLRALLFRVTLGGACATAAAAATVVLPPVGAINQTLPVGTTGTAFPLIAQDVYAGVVTGNAGTSVTFATSGLGSLVAGKPYYLEVTSGALEGERFDLATSSTLAAGGSTAVLDLGTSSFSTRSSLADGALTGARCVVRPHVTLAVIGSLFSPALVGDNNSARADGVQLYAGASGFVLYYLRADGTWRAAGSTVDQSSRVVPPDTSVTVVLRSGAKELRQAGVVRTNLFRKRLVTGWQSFASGFPVAVSPAQINGFVDTLDPLGVRWTGSDTTASADRLQVLQGQTLTYTTYQLLADGATWRQVGVAGSDAKNSAIIPATGLTLVYRNLADSDYAIAPPFAH